MEYTKEEIKQFEGEMEVYKITKNIDGKDYTFYNEDKFYKDNGGLSENGSIILKNYSSDKGKVEYTRPIIYIELREKVQQLYKFQKKREYAIKMNS